MISACFRKWQCEPLRLVSCPVVVGNAMIASITALFTQLLTAPITSETIEVRGGGAVDLATFECRDIKRSSLIQRVCYDRAQGKLIVAVNGVYDQYCDLPAATFESLMGAPSMGQFFNRNIRASAGVYHCPK